jgi:hypothetical protein
MGLSENGKNDDHLLEWGYPIFELTHIPKLPMALSQNKLATKQIDGSTPHFPIKNG